MVTCRPSENAQDDNRRSPKFHRARVDRNDQRCQTDRHRLFGQFFRFSSWKLKRIVALSSTHRILTTGRLTCFGDIELVHEVTSDTQPVL